MFAVVPISARGFAILLAMACCACVSRPAADQADKDLNDNGNRPSLNLEYVEARPSKRFIGIKNEESRFAQYAENWRSRVERVGALNYPEEAKGKLFGKLVLSVSINRDGTVKQIEIVRSSGHKILDEAARRIVTIAAPYEPFPPEILSDTDVLVIARTWSFTSNNRIETK